MSTAGIRFVRLINWVLKSSEFTPVLLTRASRILILLSSIKNSKKTFISTVLWLLYDYLSLKNDVNVASKSNRQKYLGMKVTDNISRIRIRIRNKMSRVRNTGWQHRMIMSLLCEGCGSAWILPVCQWESLLQTENHVQVSQVIILLFFLLIFYFLLVRYSFLSRNKNYYASQIEKVLGWSLKAAGPVPVVNYY